LLLDAFSAAYSGDVIRMEELISLCRNRHHDDAADDGTATTPPLLSVVDFLGNNPKPETRNPNPKPETRNPKSEP
jgi:hypothetical protein